MTRSTAKRSKFYARTTQSYPVYKTVQSYVPKAYSKELKYDSNNLTITNLLNTGHVVNLLSIANGAGPSERIGQSINLHSFRAKFRITAANNNSGNCISVSIVYDKQTNGALPAITDIFNTTDPVSLPNQSNLGRFSVLWQKTFNQAQSAAGGVDSSWNGTAPHDIRVNLLGKRSQFIGTSSSIVDIDSGSLLMVVSVSNTDVSGISANEMIKYYE
jgi:hypothetical protein